MFSHYSSFIPLVLVLFVWGTFVTLCVTVTNICISFLHIVVFNRNIQMTFSTSEPFGIILSLLGWGIVEKDDRRVVNFRLRAMVFNATFNNISVLSWRSVLLVEETRVPGENHRSSASHWQTISHKVILCTVHLAWAGFELTTLVVIGTDCIGSRRPHHQL